MNHANPERLSAEQAEVAPLNPAALPPRRPNVFARYGVAIAASAAALGLTYILLPSIQTTIFVFFFGAVVISAWYGGRGAGVLAAVLAVVLVNYFFVAPAGSLRLGRAADLVPILVFILIALLISSITERLKIEKERAIESAREAGRLERAARTTAEELEQQSEEAQAITVELEEANRELVEATKKAELLRDEALKAQETLAHTLESITDVFTVYDKNWRLVFMNGGAREAMTAMGKDPQQMIGRIIWDAFPEVAGTRFETEARRAVREGKPVDFEEYFEPTQQWFRERIYPSADGVTVYTLDITDRKNAELTLKESEARASALVSAMSDIVWFTDADGNVEDMPGWRSLTAQTIDEVRGSGWLDAVHPDDRERVAGVWRAAIEAQSRYRAEYRVSNADGVYRWYRAQAVPVLDADGDIKEWVGTLNDIDVEKQATLQERAETNLIEAINRLGAVLASELDPSRIEQTVARAATELTGAEFGTFSPAYRNEATVRSDDIVDDDRFRDNSPFIQPAAADLRSYLAVPVMSRTGEQLGGLVFGHSQPDAFTERHERIANSIASWASVSMDNARLYAAERAARAEAESANKAKSSFLATMSHELRTPLNAIGGYADLLEVGVHGELTSLQQRDVSRIKRSQHNLLALINDILNFAKIEAGRVVYSKRPMVLGEHLPELESLIAPQLRERHLEYEYLCDDPTCVAYADPEKVQQVLLNLLSNAVKFTDQGGKITLGCAADGATMRIYVRDTGVGIAESKLETIFEPFIQLDRGTTSQHDGTGLGLSISRDLARGMGGDLIAESEPGKGSIFTLQLPMHPPA
ncbi:MAG TPA: ATP-binding protein [Gemmatimonadaceae bacterium]|nr:ATP-binding protein [Gemmatimonadaceae bacterium]